jgi:CheY-like chemotaxis protein
VRHMNTASRCGGKTVVLVVEDELLIRMCTIDALEDDGYRVLEARSAAEALVLLQSGEAIDLLVTDIRMPGEMDGVALAWRASKRWPDMAIVVLSAQPRPHEDELPVGAAFLGKPASPAQIVTAARTGRIPPAVRA